jgi:membrane protease YdiL (CAAX protease family)
LLAWRIGWQYADAQATYDAIPKGMFVPHLLVATYMSASAAVVEEIAYRALPWLYFREAMAPRWRRTAYVWVTSAVFAACHSEQGPGGVIAAFWFGVVAARLYTRFGSLWPVILGHFVFDMIVFGPW